MYSNNLTTFLKSLIQDGQPVIDMTDECIAGTLVTKAGRLVHPFVRELAGLGPLEEEAAEEPATPETPAPQIPDPPPADDDNRTDDGNPTNTYRLSDE
jgi:hypothetical protein